MELSWAMKVMRYYTAYRLLHLTIQSGSEDNNNNLQNVNVNKIKVVRESDSQ